MSCLRRVTFFHQRKKGTKERRLNLRFKNPLARPAHWKIVIAYTTRLKDFARGLKCRIVSASAPLPLMIQNVGVRGPFKRAVGTPAPTQMCGVFGACFLRFGGAHVPRRDWPGDFFQPPQGAASPTPCRSAQTLLHFRASAAAAQNGSRYYI